MERVYEDCGAHPRRRGAKKIVSYIRPDDPRACAYDWRYYYGFYLGGSRMALYPANAETAKKCGKTVISLDLIRDGRRQAGR